MTNKSNSIADDQLRPEFSSACESGDYWKSKAAADAILKQNSSGASIRYLVGTIKQNAANFENIKNIRLALLSSYSIEFIRDALYLSFFRNGLLLDIYQPGFNQFRQEILDPDSSLYAFNPDILILSVEGAHLCPLLYQHSSVKNSDLLEDTIKEVHQLITTFRERSTSAIIVQNLSPQIYPGLGVGDSNSLYSTRQLVHQINHQLTQLASENRGIYILDYDALVAKYGGLNWRDERMNFYAQVPINKNVFILLAKEFAKIVRILFGGAKKCLVVDLDNTLWGGILGEDGPDNIQIGPVYPGNAFKAFQEALLSLKSRGVILAIASKNNLSDVKEAFTTNTHMALKLDDFSDKQIHWQEKSLSLMEIATNLNIGLEHMVFVDDNPVECEQIKQSLPMVEVINFPKQPENYAACLFEEGFFDTLQESREDMQRASLYKQRSDAEAFRKQASNMKDFYRGLQMEIQFAKVDDKSVTRTAQLTQKTNQFNATTQRYSEANLEVMMADDNWCLYNLSVKDKFGDNGIVGVLFAQIKDDIFIIDTFLLSCRVIGRTVERAMLAFLCTQARLNRLSFLVGKIHFTPKNMPVRDVYKDFGFEEIHSTPEETQWRLEVNKAKTDFPDWFQINDKVNS